MEPIVPHTVTTEVPSSRPKRPATSRLYPYCPHPERLERHRHRVPQDCGKAPARAGGARKPLPDAERAGVRSGLTATGDNLEFDVLLLPHQWTSATLPKDFLLTRST